MYTVGEMSFKGKNPHEIAKALDIKFKDVTYLQKQWVKHLNGIAHGNLDLHDRVMQIIIEIDLHFKRLIKESWDIIEESRQGGDNRTANTAIANVHKIEKDRAGIWQSAGQDNTAEIMAQVRQAEEMHKKIKEIFSEVLCTRCKQEVRRRLADIEDTVVEAEIVSS